jgi:multimeric flavodoxin WrbA
MLVLGLQGSPRKKGNTNYLLSTFMDEAEKFGARTQVVDATHKNIIPCKEYIVCEKKGFCPIDDDMKDEIYPLLREADVIVLASPVFFYNVTAQLKALIDRSQTLWARKYKLNLTDPARNYRRGFLLSVGATKGKNLFEGIDLTAQYFFEPTGASKTREIWKNTRRSKKTSKRRSPAFWNRFSTEKKFCLPVGKMPVVAKWLRPLPNIMLETKSRLLAQAARLPKKSILTWLRSCREKGLTWGFVTQNHWMKLFQHHSPI